MTKKFNFDIGRVEAFLQLGWSYSLIQKELRKIGINISIKHILNIKRKNYCVPEWKKTSSKNRKKINHR